MKPMPKDMAGWVRQREAARTLRCSVRALARLRAEGELTARTHDRLVYYDPKQLQEYLQRNPTPEHEASHEPTAIALERMTDLVRTLSAQTQAFAGLVLEPAQQMLRMYGEENQRLRERCASLEQRHSDMIDQYEAAQTLTHERKIEAEKVSASIRMRTEMLSMLGPKVDAVLSGFMGKRSATTELEKWFAELDPADLKIAHDMGLLDAEKFKAAMALHAALSPAKPNGMKTEQPKEQDNAQ